MKRNIDPESVEEKKFQKAFVQHSKVVIDPIIYAIMEKLKADADQEIYIVGTEGSNLPEVFDQSKEDILKALKNFLKDDCKYTFAVCRKGVGRS